MEKFFRENPGEEARTLALAQQVREAAARTMANPKAASSPVTIPVVFHILYSNVNISSQRIEPSLVAAEINYLNQWYSTNNANYGRTSSYWSSVKAVADDFKISFALATKDPNGNPTTGIIYHESSITATCGGMEIVTTASGGADAWNQLQYMNIWTCPITQSAGYAYLPSSGVHPQDGVVMQPQYIGYAYTAGSLVAHEVGHYFGLPHTFNGTATYCTNADGVADTPLTDVPAWNYNTNRDLCSNTAASPIVDGNFQRCSNYVQVQNNMDYNYEECKSFFTKGQVAVMRGNIDGSGVRGGLKTSPGLGSQSCTPNCASKYCGDNGCGGVCGTCLSGSTCSAGACTVGGTPGASLSPTPTPTPTPTRSPAAGVSTMPNALIIQKINGIRAAVSPPAATPLTNLTYSTTLENQAKTQTQACVNSLASGQTGFIFGGDLTGNLNSVFTQFLDNVASKKQYYTLTNTTGTCASGQSCGSYIQTIWNHASYPTTQVGCYASYCASGFGSPATFAVCQFAGPGNYVGLLPYQICTTAACNPSCVTECQVGQCGTVQTACGTLDCGPCCSNPCTTNQCGSQLNSCGASINCGTCQTGYSCTAGGSGTTCVADPVCVHANECAAGGFTCGNKVFCGVNQACGYCGSGQICSNYQCIADPCAGCGPNSQCVNSQCSCLSGYVLQNGVCTQQSVGIDYTTMFTQTSPASPIGFVIPQSDLILTGTGPHVLKWTTSQNVVNLYTTKTSINVTMASGEFGFNIRHGQATNANDRIMWHVKGIGASPTIAICLVYYGSNYCSSYSAYPFPTTSTIVTVTMGFDGGSNILTTFKAGSGSTWNSQVSTSYYPSLGAISYFVSKPSGAANPILADATLATSSTLTVSLVECITESQWSTMFYALTGANPATTQVQTRAQGQNGNCKGVTVGGKEAASGFTVVVTSTAVDAASIVSTLTSSVGSPTGAAVGLLEATAIAGTAGANAAGFATTIAALGGTTIAAPVAAAGAGAAGGGAAAGGLSGGAIAGIVIGSVAGAVLIVGITAAVVAVVIVAAVIVAKKSGSEESDNHVSDGPTRSDDRRTSKRIRDTLYDIFRAPKGGVDIMNNPSGHQSITARSPQA